MPRPCKYVIVKQESFSPRKFTYPLLENAKMPSWKRTKRKPKRKKKRCCLKSSSIANNHTEIEINGKRARVREMHTPTHWRREWKKCHYILIRFKYLTISTASRAWKLLLIAFPKRAKQDEEEREEREAEGWMEERRQSTGWAAGKLQIKLQKQLGNWTTKMHLEICWKNWNDTRWAEGGDAKRSVAQYQAGQTDRQRERVRKWERDRRMANWQTCKSTDKLWVVENWAWSSRGCTGVKWRGARVGLRREAGCGGLSAIEMAQSWHCCRCCCCCCCCLGMVRIFPLPHCQICLPAAAATVQGICPHPPSTLKLTVALSKTSWRLSFPFFWSGSKVLWACVAHKWKFLLDPCRNAGHSLSHSTTHSLSHSLSARAACPSRFCPCLVQRCLATASARSLVKGKSQTKQQQHVYGTGPGSWRITSRCENYLPHQAHQGRPSRLSGHSQKLAAS